MTLYTWNILQNLLTETLPECAQNNKWYDYEVEE